MYFINQVRHVPYGLRASCRVKSNGTVTSTVTGVQSQTAWRTTYIPYKEPPPPPVPRRRYARRAGGGGTGAGERRATPADTRVYTPSRVCAYVHMDVYVQPRVTTYSHEGRVIRVLWPRDLL